MVKIRLGQIEYLNCLPVYHALEEGLFSLGLNLVQGSPTRLNQMFFSDELDCTALSSIEYARHREQCLIIPDLSISADGRVESILLFSRVPVTELDGAKVALTSSSATSVALLKILFEHYYHVEVTYVTMAPDLDSMLAQSQAALLIGDDALSAASARESSLYITDLGEAWKQFTGEPFVYALWVVRSSFAQEHPRLTERLAKTLKESRQVGFTDLGHVIDKGTVRTGLDREVVENYFQTIRLEFTGPYRKALALFYDYAYKSALIDERITHLRVLGENNE